MKKKIRMWTSILLACCMAVSLAGCKKKEDKNSEYRIYYINQDGTGLVEAGYSDYTDDPKQAVSEMLDTLGKTEDEVEMQPVLPVGVELQEYMLKDEKLDLYFNAEYGEMDRVREVLCRAALVRSLTQIEGVDLVAVYVNGNPLTDKDGEIYGYQQAEDFVQNTGSSINSYQVSDFTLYFANETGDRLVRETVSIRFNSNQPQEKVVVERLMKGPAGSRELETIPGGTKLLGVSIKDGICYLNFDEGLNTITPGVSPETVLYSIVNSVTECGTVEKVQISINGESNFVFQESVKLAEPLRSNPDIVEEE